MAFSAFSYVLLLAPFLCIAFVSTLWGVASNTLVVGFDRIVALLPADPGSGPNFGGPALDGQHCMVMVVRIQVLQDNRDCFQVTALAG